MEMYRVTQIEGKGFGVVATKFIKRGTLIFKEKPQMPCVDEPLPHLQMQPDSWKDYFKRVMSLFDQMSESDQEKCRQIKECQKIKLLRTNHAGFEKACVCQSYERFTFSSYIHIL